MSDKPETLAAVLAEMRDHADHRAADAGGERPGIELLRSYADRIEAAAERERNAHTNDIHDALYLATGITGNAAAMRDALVEILNRTNREKARDYDAALIGGILEIHDIANTALNQTKGE